MNTKRLIVLAAIETVVIALGVCMLLFAFRYTPPPGRGVSIRA